MSSPVPSPSSKPSAYMFDTATEYRMKERVYHPDSFDAQTVPDNRQFVTVKGKVTSFHGEKTMYDNENNPVFKMTENSADTLQLMYLYDYRAKCVYTIRKKGFLPGRGRGTVYVWKGKGLDGEPYLEMASSALRSTILVTEYEKGGAQAQITRSNFGIRRLFTGADSYLVKVFPGVDAALMLMLTVAADEHYTDFNR